MVHARKKKGGASCYLVSPEIDMNQALAFSKEDLHSLCDYGLYNAVIAGYLIQSMRNAGFQKKSIEKAFQGLHTAFDTLSAQEAEEVFRKF